MSPAVTRVAHASSTRKIAERERRRILAFSDTWHRRSSGLAETSYGESIDLVERLGAATTKEVGKQLPYLTIPIMLGAGTRQEISVPGTAESCSRPASKVGSYAPGPQDRG